MAALHRNQFPTGSSDILLCLLSMSLAALIVVSIAEASFCFWKVIRDDDCESTVFFSVYVLISQREDFMPSVF